MRRTNILFATAGTILLASCSGWQLAQGDKAYARMAYARASAHYGKALSENVDDRAVLLRAADTERRLRHHADAADLYGKALKSGPLGAEDAIRYGEVLMALGKRNEASERFMDALALNPERSEVRDLILSCEQDALFLQDSARYVVSALPIDGFTNAFSPIPYADGLVFTGERADATSRSNPWNGNGYLDLFYARKRSFAIWEAAVPLPGDVNGAYHEGPACFSADGRTMFFSRSNYYRSKLLKNEIDESNIKLFRATLDSSGHWGDMHEFAYNSDDYSVGQPAISGDGRVLYFVSDMPGTLGGKDIFRCVNNGTGWGPPENLGPTVNTAGDEMFPTICGDVLYFASTAHMNMGGLDIFSTHAEGAGWSRPENMGYPINSAFDDLGMTLSEDGKHGYFSSDRSGRDRLYQFFVKDPVLFVDGSVFDDTTGTYLPQVEMHLTALDGDTEMTVLTAMDGSFRFPMKAGKRYRLEARMEGRLTESREISTEGSVNGTSFRENIHLITVQLDKPFLVENIYYDYDKWDIRPDAAPELDKLAKLFTDNPRLTFELSAHTDCRGSDLYNLVLSDARANSAVDYLIRMGVDPDRITSKGYGESRPVNGCIDGRPCTEEDYQMNRRTEFKIVKVNELASGR